MTELFLLLLPLAAFSGWWLARTDKQNSNEQKADDYFQGLGYLLEDKTDKAIDIFVRIAHLDDSTIENQITLGNLFRYRGEIDRALHIHSTLLDKGALSEATRQQLHLALGDDYCVAGIMNHAESHYLLASEEANSDIRNTAMRNLIYLYSEQSLWHKAIEIGEALDPFRRTSIQKSIAHFHCEISKTARENGDSTTAHKELELALACDSKCVRATIKLGRICANNGDHVEALGYWHRLEKQNPAFLPEVLDDFEASYSAINQLHEWKKTLQKFAHKYKNPLLVLRYQHIVCETEGMEQGASFLQEMLEQQPSMITITAYIDTLAVNTQNAEYTLLKDSMNMVMSRALKYRCCECGFRGNQLNWQCPGCKQWGTFTPVTNIGIKENLT